MNYSNFPKISSFKMTPCNVAGLSNMHMDYSWVYEQARDFETKVFYKQKWVKSNTTTLQVETTIPPSDLIIYQVVGGLLIQAKTIAWVKVFETIDYKIWELPFDVSDLDSGIYVLYQLFSFLAINWAYLSEPIHIADSWPGTRLVEYKHSFNDYDVAWSTGIKMKFRCEMDIMDFNPESDRTEWANQLQGAKTLKGVPYRSFKLLIGDAFGVPPYIIDIMNRITLCDYQNYEGKLYERAIGSKWGINSIRGSRMQGAEVQVVEATNEYSLHFNDNGAPLAPGLITAYNIDTTVFSGGTLVPIFDVQTQQ